MTDTPRVAPRTGVEDTPADIEARVIEGYRAMTPAQKMDRVVALNRAVEQLARARIEMTYGPDLSEREVRLRLASLRLPRETMIEVFDWDPVEKGY